MQRASPPPAHSAPGLQRTLSFWQVTVSGVGIVIGAGIYVLIGDAAKEAGAAVWLSFALSAVLSALTGLSYAELAGMFPVAGAEYEFARRAFNDFVGFMAGWTMVAGNIVAAGAVSIGFAHYLRHFFEVDQRVASLALLSVLTLIIAAGVQRSIWLSVVLAVLQVGGLLLVIAVGAPHVGSRSLLEDGTVAGVLSASALVFFAFIGFDEVVTLSEETRDAEHVIPRALLTALAISAALYMLVGITAVSVVGADALGASDRPLALVIQHDWGGRASGIVAFIALASTTNTTLLVLTAASRLLFGMSRNGALPRQFATVGRRAHSPYVAAGLAFVIAALFALVGSIGFIASVTDFAVYAIFLAVNGSLIVLRLRLPDAARTFRVPLRLGRVPVTPLAGIATVLLMLAYLEPRAWIVGGAALVAGVAVWLLYAQRHVSRAGT